MKNWVILFLVTAIILSGCMQPAEAPEEPQPVEEPMPMEPITQPTQPVPTQPTTQPTQPVPTPEVPTGPEMQEQIKEEQEQIGPIDYTEDVYFPPVGTEKTTSTTNSSLWDCVKAVGREKAGGAKGPEGSYIYAQEVCVYLTESAWDCTKAVLNAGGDYIEAEQQCYQK